MLQLQRWSQKLRLFLDPQNIQMIYTWKVHSFGYGPSTAILRWYLFILFPSFSISFQVTHPVLPIQLPPLGALLLPGFNLQFRLLLLDMGFMYRKHKPGLKWSTGITRPLASPEPTVQKPRMKQNVKAMQRDVHPDSSWVPHLKSNVIPCFPPSTGSTASATQRKRHAEIQNIKRSFYKNAVCSSSHLPWPYC